MPIEASREYSKLLGVLTPDQLQSALDRFDLGTLLDAQPAPGGLFGQNVLLTASSGGWVLRGCPYPRQLEKERYFSQVICECSSAHAPWPYHIEESTDLFGWSYAMMPLLPGLHLSDPEMQRSLSKGDRVELARAMGAYLGRMHEATWDTPGVYDYDRCEIAPLSAPFVDWFPSETRRWLAMCRDASSETTDADVEWIEGVIDRGRDALAVPFTPALVHTDYKEGNVVAERADAGWKVGGIFDSAEAYAGDGEYDLARSACTYGMEGRALLAAFVGGYAAKRPPRRGFEERFALYLLHDRLIIWEYGQRNNVWFQAGTSFNEWAQPFVDLAKVASDMFLWA